jgi:YggT family protein
VFVVGNLLGAVAWLLHQVLMVYTFVILINALLSWVRPDPFNPIVRTLARLSDLVLDPIRRLVPMQSLGIDLSPLLAILLLQFTDLVLVRSLGELAARL